MNNREATYYLSGKAYTKGRLLQFCHVKMREKHVNAFEKELLAFIIDWFSPSQFINAQTSGSTGKPKEIQLLKKYMMASAVTTNSFFNLKKKDKILLCLPMSFIAGKMMVVRALAGSLDLYFSEPSSKPVIIDEQIKFTAMVPLQVSSLLNENIDAIENIEKLIIGGAFISGLLFGQLQQIKTQVWQTYGMTETMTHIAIRKLNGAKRQNRYQPLPGVSVKLDQRGCLVVKAKHLGVDELVTNDLADIEKNGTFQILGRVDDVIVSGGLKFNPVEIENKLSGIVSNDFFIGSLDDHELGQKLLLFIEKGGQVERRIFDIWSQLEERLERLEMPKEIIFIGSFARTAAGKTDRISTIKEYKNSFNQ
ncbi:MAG: o-succinylbenzoate--CoA ligase [Marinilabiliales bacterium]|nr:MAG: o-succinylbenzoate--CoA ligase [Marinilabiliales bacterium]